jgi:HK97 family phage prohead protease
MPRAPIRKKTLTRRAPTPGARDIRSTLITPSTYDAGSRTVEAVLSTGAGVMRWFGEEELIIAPDAIDLSRVASGQVKVLDSHNANSIDAQLGSLISARIEGGQLVGVIQFADSDRGRRAEAAVAAGELNGISIGYTVTEWEEVERVGQCDLYRASAWSLLEASFVTVPADPYATTRSLPGRATRAPGTSVGGSGGSFIEKDMDEAIDHNPDDDNDMAMPVDTSEEDPLDREVAENDDDAAEPPEDDEPEEDPDDEPGERGAVPTSRNAKSTAAATPAPTEPKDKRAMKITVSEALELGRQAESLGVDRAAVEVELAKPDMTADAARSFILGQAAAAQSTRTAFSAARVTRDERDTQGEAITDLLISRMTPGSVPTEKARTLSGARISDIFAERHGINSRDPAEILSRASMTTGDFPNLLEAAANKVLLGAYLVAAPTYREFCKAVTFNDFKVHKFLRVGDFPALQAITETADVPNASFSENRETVTPVTRGVLVPLSRQMLINDDLGAFGDLVNGAGREAARTENQLAYANLISASGAGPTMSDGNALYSTAHANYAGTGTAITIAALGAARAAMRKQKGVGGTQPLNLSPTVIVVGPDKETEAQQLIAPIQAQQAGNVNPFSGLLKVVSDAQMVSNNSGLSWNLFADPQIAPTIVYGYLRDSNGPQIVQFQPANIDGIQLRVLHDFGVGVVDYRGTYRNLGA